MREVFSFFMKANSVVIVLDEKGMTKNSVWIKRVCNVMTQENCVIKLPAEPSFY